MDTNVVEITNQVMITNLEVVTYVITNTNTITNTLSKIDVMDVRTSGWDIASVIISLIVVYIMLYTVHKMAEQNKLSAHSVEEMRKQSLQTEKQTHIQNIIEFEKRDHELLTDHFKTSIIEKHFIKFFIQQSNQLDIACEYYFLLIKDEESQNFFHNTIGGLIRTYLESNVEYYRNIQKTIPGLIQTFMIPYSVIKYCKIWKWRIPEDILESTKMYYSKQGLYPIWDI